MRIMPRVPTKHRTLTSSLQRLLITIMKKSTFYDALQPWKTFLHSLPDKTSANRGFTRIIASARRSDVSLSVNQIFQFYNFPSYVRHRLVLHREVSYMSGFDFSCCARLPLFRPCVLEGHVSRAFHSDTIKAWRLGLFFLKSGAHERLLVIDGDCLKDNWWFASTIDENVLTLTCRRNEGKTRILLYIIGWCWWKGTQPLLYLKKLICFKTKKNISDLPWH